MKSIIFIILTINLAFSAVFDFKTISSNFIQTITNEEKSKIIYEGKFWATSDAKALWIYKKPVEKKIYFNKNRVVILEPELEQAIITNLKHTPNLTEILKNSKKISNNIFEAIYEDITYKIELKNGTIEKIFYEDKLANEVVIKFFNQQTDLFLDEKLFVPKIPNYYDIIAQ